MMTGSAGWNWRLREHGFGKKKCGVARIRPKHGSFFPKKKMGGSDGICYVSSQEGILS